MLFIWNRKRDVYDTLFIDSQDFFKMSVTEITVPCSTSNLGASFDTCGLALSLYLRLKVEPQSSGFQVELTGEGAGVIPCDESNFIIQVAQFVAQQRQQKIGGAKLKIHSEIPLARGLGRRPKSCCRAT